MSALIALAAVSTIAPLIVFRGSTLRRYFAFDATSYLFACAFLQIAPPFDPDLALIAFGVAKLAVFSLVLARGNGVRWSANRAAVVAALVYALVVPTQMRTPIDGDEPYYLLMTESLIADRDVDLANQYRDLSKSASGRLDLGPQPGDPAGPRGQQYSRHEPFLALLLVPGYLAGGLPGALATIALFATLLVRSTVRWMEDEGIADTTIRAVVPLFAFAPPVVFYAARIWPEVPAAFFLVEAIRGIRNRRVQRWVPVLVALVLLKLRFVLVGGLLVLRAVWERRSRGALVALAALAVPLLIVFWISGSVLNVHTWRELLPFAPRLYVIGAFGLLLDGAAGFLFQAPLYIAGIVALARWNSMPEGFRLGCFSAFVYVFYLVPRSEWHGGWSPPLRYVVIFTPVLALGAAAMLQRSRVALGLFAPAVLWTAGLTIHGLRYPWRLFHIASGENAVGEWLSQLHGTDFSRLFPSFIRLNDAAVVAGVALGVVVLVVAVSGTVPWRRWRFSAGGAAGAPLSVVTIGVLSLALALLLAAGLQPGRVVEFEDAHVTHDGGELFPELYIVARFRFRGGWILREGESVAFLSRRGTATLSYSAPFPLLMEMGERTFPLRATGDGYATARVEVARAGRVTLRCLSGAVNLDRMEFDE